MILEYNDKVFPSTISSLAEDGRILQQKEMDSSAKIINESKVMISKLAERKGTFNAMNEVADWLGAIGYTKEYPIEMGIRGVRSYSIGAEGTLNIMRIIIARELLGREYLPYGVR
jgi:alkylation response protein AidB-like acyl-CoA dehydrogenase